MKVAMVKRPVFKNLDEYMGLEHNLNRHSAFSTPHLAINYYLYISPRTLSCLCKTNLLLYLTRIF